MLYPGPTFIPFPRLGVAAIFALAAWSCGATAGPQQAAPAQQGAAAQQQSGAQRPLAEVNGRAITEDEVARALGQNLARLEEQVYMLKRQGIDALVADRLLAAEATKRGVTVERLVEAEVSSKVPPASDAEVDNFCARNPGQCDQRASNDGSPRLEQVRAYLTEQKRTARRDAFVAALRATSDVKVYLAAVPVFRAEVGPGATPVRGPANAPITIVEFSDFHCPYCRMVQPTLDRILEKYPTQVRFAYRDIPLDALHPQARAVAEAARCANDQGKFWPFHDTVYRSAARADETSLKMMAAAAGLDVAPFMACVASGKHKASLEQDAADAARLGVNSTPSFFINGRPLRGAQPFEAFVQVIEDELARARK